MATNNSNGTCPAKQPACPKTSPQRLAQKATTITPTWQAYSQNSSLLVTVHHQDTSSLLGQGRQSLLSISPHTFPPHCFPAQIQGQKPHFIRATTGSNSTKSSMPKQLLQMHNGVLHKEHELMLQLWRSKLPLWCLLGRPPLHHLSATAGELFFSISMHLGTFSQVPKSQGRQSKIT